MSESFKYGLKPDTTYIVRVNGGEPIEMTTENEDQSEDEAYLQQPDGTE